MNKDGFIDFDEIIKIMPDSLIADPEAVKTVIKTCNQMSMINFSNIFFLSNRI